MTGIDWGAYVGRTTYGNIVSLETRVAPKCNVPLESLDFHAETVMAIPIKGFGVDGQIGGIQDSVFVIAPEILKVVSPENPVCVAFKTPIERRPLAHPDNSRVILALDSVLQLEKRENEMPLDFRLNISEALVVMK